MVDQSVELLGQQLKTMGRSSPHRESWRTLLRMAGAPPSFGEVRSQSEWQQVPADCWVRVVYLIDDLGPVIRWVVPNARSARVLGGFFHDHLENGDSHNSARSGWLRRSLDGSVEVR